MERPSTTAFVSYSWDSDEHKAWVRALAGRIRADGVDAKLDQWETAPGDQLPEFMERGVRELDFVVIICTPKYRERSDARTGGVGFEGHIMTGEVMTGKNDRKFIPVWRAGTWEEAAPSWLAGKYHIDLTGDPYDEEQYADLIRTLRGERPKAPPIGPRASREGAKAVDVDGLDEPSQAVRSLAAGVQLTYFQERLGDPTFRTRGEASDEHIFVHDAFYVQAITDRSGTVTLYSVTTRAEDFDPVLDIDYGWPTLKVTLGRDTFASVGTEPVSRGGYLGARRFHYWESHYLGNPGLYQTYIVSLNDAGYMGARGDLVAAIGALSVLKSEEELAAAAEEEALELLDLFAAETVVNTYSVASVSFPRERIQGMQFGPDKDQVRVI